MARAAAMDCSVLLDSVRAEINNAKQSWEVTHKEMIRMLAIAKAALLAVRALSLAMASVMVSSRTSSMERTVAAEATARM
jgi:hypothetical protein